MSFNYGVFQWALYDIKPMAYKNLQKENNSLKWKKKWLYQINKRRSQLM